MYAPPDEARSDLFFSGAVFLFGPLILGVLFDIIPVEAIPGVPEVLSVAQPLAVTVLVPWLLIRYRQESLRDDYGFGPQVPKALGYGALLGLPVVVAAVGSGILADTLTTVPVVELTGDQVVPLLGRLATWLGRVGLAVYATIKARSAFAGEVATLRDWAVRFGRVIAAVSAAGIALLAFVAAPEALPGLVLFSVAVAVVVALTLRGISGPTTAIRPTLLTPVVLLVLGGVEVLSFGDLPVNLWLGSLLAGLGLVVGLLVESRHSSWVPVGLAVVVALGSSIG